MEKIELWATSYSTNLGWMKKKKKPKESNTQLESKNPVLCNSHKCSKKTLTMNNYFGCNKKKIIKWQVATLPNKLGCSLNKNSSKYVFK